MLSEDCSLPCNRTDSVTVLNHRNVINMPAMPQSEFGGCTEGTLKGCKSEVSVLFPQSREKIRLELQQDRWLFGSFVFISFKFKVRLGKVTSIIKY